MIYLGIIIGIKFISLFALLEKELKNSNIAGSVGIILRFATEMFLLYKVYELIA